MLTTNDQRRGISGLLSRDGMAGLLLMLFAIAVLWVNSGLDFGTPRSMGPGFLLRFMAIGVLLCGGLFTVRAFIQQSEPVTWAEFAAAPWRGLIAVTASIALFTLLLRPAGLMLAGFVMIVALSFANPKFRPIETLVFAVVSTIGITALFAWGLRIRVPVWPSL